MPKPITRRFEGLLLAYKGDDKPKKAKVHKITSPYAGTEGSTFSGPFASGESGFQTVDGKKQIVTNMTLAPPLQQAGETAATGLNNNLGFLQRDPNERINFLRSGQDPTYSILNEQAQNTFNTNLGRLKLNAQQAGGTNSTAMGAAYGQLLRDKNLLDNQILLQGLNFGNETARADANTNLGAIGNLAQLVYPLGSAANAQFNTSLQDQGRAQAATAQARNAAEQQYTNSLNQYNQNKNAGLGSGIGSLVGAGLGALLAIPTGGLSLAGGAMLGSSLGGAAGGLFGGGGGGSASPVYIPQSFGSSAPAPSYNLGGIPGYQSGGSNLWNDSYWNLGAQVV